MSKKIDDLYKQIKRNANGIEAFLAKLPGLRGYMERQTRRDADQLLRETIVGRLQETRKRLAAVSQDLARNITQAIAYAESLGRADTKLTGLIGKIEAAPQGYAGFFAAAKVDSAVLARLYTFDEAMLDHITQLDADVAALAKAVRDDGDIQMAIGVLTSSLQTANEAFAQRRELLTGIDEF